MIKQNEDEGRCLGQNVQNRDKVFPGISIPIRLRYLDRLMLSGEVVDVSTVAK